MTETRAPHIPEPVRSLPPHRAAILGKCTLASPGWRPAPGTAPPDSRGEVARDNQRRARECSAFLEGRRVGAVAEGTDQ